MEEKLEIKCKECGETFEISAGEQKFFEERGLAIPKRCKDCRIARKNKLI